MSPGDTAGEGSHPLLCQRRGAQALPCFAGCCDRLDALRTRFALDSGGGGGGGCRGAAANLRSSQDNSEHGGLCCSLGGSCIPLRDPHQVGEGPPTIRGPAEPGEGLGALQGLPQRPDFSRVEFLLPSLMSALGCPCPIRVSACGAIPG